MFGWAMAPLSTNNHLFPKKIQKTYPNTKRIKLEIHTYHEKRVTALKNLRTPTQILEQDTVKLPQQIPLSHPQDGLHCYVHRMLTSLPSACLCVCVMYVMYIIT